MSKLIAVAADTCIPAPARHSATSARRGRPAFPAVDPPDNQELDRWSNRLARMLMHQGVGPGCRVTTAGLPPLERALTRWAVAKIGATARSATCTSPGPHVRFGVTTKAARPELTDDIRWLVLDDRSALIQYLTGSDAPITDDELGVVRAAC